MTAEVSNNSPLGFFSGKWSAVGAKTDFICTCLSFGRCVVPKTNRYFYTFALWNMKRSKLKLLTSRLPLRWISLTSSSFKHHASFIIEIHQLAFLEHANSVARKYFEFDYSLSICLPLVEWVKYKTPRCILDSGATGNCWTGLNAKRNWEKQMITIMFALEKLKGDVNKVDCYAYRCEQAVTS